MFGSYVLESYVIQPSYRLVFEKANYNLFQSHEISQHKNKKISV